MMVVRARSAGVFERRMLPSVLAVLRTWECACRCETLSGEEAPRALLCLSLPSANEMCLYRHHSGVSASLWWQGPDFLVGRAVTSIEVAGVANTAVDS